MDRQLLETRRKFYVENLPVSLIPNLDNSLISSPCQQRGGKGQQLGTLRKSIVEQTRTKDD